MCYKTLKQFAFWILTTLVTTGASTAAMAQTNILPIGPQEVEVQVRQQWKDGERTCEKSNQTKIDRVDIITSFEFRNWLLARHPVYGDSVELFPKGNYVRVASSGEHVDDGITVFGPVFNSVKSADFRNIIGMPTCNFKVLN